MNRAWGVPRAKGRIRKRLHPQRPHPRRGAARRILRRNCTCAMHVAYIWQQFSFVMNIFKPHPSVGAAPRWCDTGRIRECGVRRLLFPGQPRDIPFSGSGRPRIIFGNFHQTSLDGVLMNIMFCLIGICGDLEVISPLPQLRNSKIER